jgi:hypothetical protein
MSLGDDAIRDETGTLLALAPPGPQFSVATESPTNREDHQYQYGHHEDPEEGEPDHIGGQERVEEQRGKHGSPQGRGPNIMSVTPAGQS